MTMPEQLQQQWPSVTVVVPTRDRPELLREALAAIGRQDYPGDVHTLVVYDQSEPDESLQSSAPNRGVEVIRNIRTPGLAGGRNSGILAANGELVAFCDDDDAWHPGRLQTQLLALRDAPEAVMVTCGIRVRYGDHDVDRSLPQVRVALNDLLRSRLTELHPSTFLIVRKALIESIGLVNEEIPGSYAEDYEFLLRAARTQPLVNVPEILVDVRWHQRSYFSGRWETISTALNWLLDHYPEFRDEPRGEARILGQIAFSEAAAGNRRQALRFSARTLRRHPVEGRAILALAVASGAVRPERVLAALHRRGRGI